MIRKIIFDMGQVLIRFSPRDIAERENVPREQIELFLREVFGNQEWIALDRGTMNADEAIAGVCARLPESLHPAAVAAIHGWWRHPLTPIAGMAELIQELKALGYGIYLLSNAPSNLHKYFHRIPGADCFDGKVVSGDWKLLKPHAEIYWTLYDQFRLNPAECLFIDDSPANIDGAFQTGMKGIIFHGDTARLRRELNSMGVPVTWEGS